MILLIGTQLGLHYRAVAEDWAGGDFGRRLGGELEREFVQQQRQLGLRLGVAGEDQLAAVGGRDVHIDHLHGGELLDHAARRQPRRQGVQSSIQRDVQAIGEEGDEDMCLDASLELMEDGTDGQIALEVLERLFDRDELQIEVPQLRRIGFGEIGAQQIAAFAPPSLAELVAAEPIAERGRFFGELDFDQTPSGRGLVRARRRASSAAPRA